MKRTISLLLLSWGALHTGFAAPVRPVDNSMDSLLPVNITWDVKREQGSTMDELTSIESGNALTRDTKRAFSRLARLGRFRALILNGRARSRLFNDLAGAAVRLRLYGIAMQCYYGAEHPAVLPDTTAPGDSTRHTLQDAAFFQQLFSLDTCTLPGNTVHPVTPQPVKVEDILASFDDGKTASSFALLVHVKQPAPGKRKAFRGIGNVGHMFITLIKYNRDQSTVSRSFGFYPHKSGLLSATPLHPSSPSVVKDDAGHDWDEIAGKFISSRRFRKILEALRSYDHQVYHLNRNNCTDFGLAMARLGGINITGTIGRWPLGKGNNPGSAGQSMLEGNIHHSDNEYPDPLFVCSNVPSIHR